MTKIEYRTKGTCAQLIEVTGENGRVVDVSFYGGCNGNLQGIASLVKGMEYDKVIERQNGICCGYKSTSCPDQLCRAIEQLKAEENNG